MPEKGKLPKNIKLFIEGGKKNRFKKGEHRNSKTEFKKGNIPWNKNKKIWGENGILKKIIHLKIKNIPKKQRKVIGKPIQTEINGLNIFKTKNDN
jgi:hypothetical protein